MLKAFDLAVRRGARLLLDKGSFAFFGGQRVGVVGRNGCGKSSMFALINGSLEPDAGRVEMPGAWTVGEVEQHAPDSSLSALEYVKQGDRQLAEIDARRGDADHDIAMHAEHDFAELDGYRWEARAGELINGLGFSAADQQRQVNDFSGGWRMRLALAQTLMRRADLLLLDEPTNHLDLDAILWLAEYLKRFEGLLLVISHDRDFLDQVCTHILHLDAVAQTALSYTGNFSDFARQRAERAALQRAEAVQIARQRAHLKAFIDRFKAKASKARQAQSRVKMLEKLGDAPAPRDADSFDIPMPKPAKLPSQVLKLIDAQAAYDDTVILEGINMTLEPGDRIGLLGRNGAGKSTLMKLLGGALKPRRGERWTAPDSKVGYFSQFEVEALPPERTPLELLMDRAPTVSQQKLRDWLGSFKYGGDLATQPLGPRSGGEKARFVLAMLLFDAPNLILLDEPTNHLDLEMREALAESLNDFEGALVLVAHDRNLLETCCDRFMLVRDGHAVPFDGDLDDYSQWLKQQRANSRREEQAQKNAPAQTTTTTTASAAPKPVASATPRGDSKKLQTEYRKRDTELKRLNDALAALEKQQQELAVRAPADRAGLQKLARDIAAMRPALEQAEAAWMEAAEALEQAGIAA